MKASNVAELLNAKVFCGEEFLDEVELDWAFGSDMMSDVLAYVSEKTLILTGMINAHTIRTAEIVDVRCIVFVRGKTATDEMIQLAKERDIILLGTEETLFTSCGVLYEAGLRSCTGR